MATFLGSKDLFHDVFADQHLFRVNLSFDLYSGEQSSVLCVCVYRAAAASGSVLGRGCCCDHTLGEEKIREQPPRAGQQR